MAAVIGPVTALAADRAAVVIGNGAYAAQPAATPVQDARLIANSLREMNFDVLLVENVNSSGLARLPDVAAAHFDGAKVKFLYFAGYVIPLESRQFDPSHGRSPTDRMTTCVRKACRSRP